MRPKYTIICANLIAMALISSAWSAQDNRLRPSTAQQTPTTQADPSESDCEGLIGSEWRACMRASVACFGMHGRAYEDCCASEKESSACGE